MCGIAGIVHLDGRPVDRGELLRINQALSHRGPDGDGVYVDGGIGLAHRRLAIIDPSLGVQPFLVPEAQLALTFNGEIYNYIELKEELKESYTFSTTSDTEVLVRAYQRWGIRCLERLRGMFAFALLDRRAQKLFLVRDRVGIKPLYIWRAPSSLYFASELSALAKAASFPRKVDAQAVAAYFQLQYVPAPRSIYRGVEKLRPAYFLEIDLSSRQCSEHRYWDLELAPQARPEGELLEELNEVLDETVRIYVRSDVPFGAFLSGGVDSSLVTAVMGRHLKEPVRTFSIGFEEEAHSELPFAAQAARLLGASHHERVVTADLASGVLERLAWHYGEPFGDSSAVPTYYVSKEAASEVKMVLSGDGGDELFGGYNSYRALQQELERDPLGLMGAMKWLGIRGLDRVPGLGAVVGRLSQLGGRALRRAPDSVRGVLHRLRSQQLQPFHDQHRQAFDAVSLRGLLRPEVHPGPPVAIDGVGLAADVDPLTWFQAHDFKTYLVDDVLTKVDRASMACSLEVRVPLLDHRLVELAFRLPLSAKVIADGKGGITTKVLLKRSAERFFSPSFLERPKRGFGIPVVEWCRGPLRSRIEDGLRDRQSGLYEWARFDAVQTILDEFFAGKESHVARVWYLMMFDLWVRHVHQVS